MAIKLDIDKLAATLGNFAREALHDLEKAGQQLGAAAHAKITELANEELKSTKKTYTDALGMEEISPGVWCITLDESALFIEDGISANFDMKPGLLKNATKTSKEGYKYRSIPFDLSKAPAQRSEGSQKIMSELKTGLRKVGIPMHKIENDANGNPRLGVLHRLNLASAKPTAKASHGALQGVQIRQTAMPGGKVQRSIMTFRTVSSGPKSMDKWIHPGLEAHDFFGKAERWAEEQWENVIAPSIIEKWKA